jgi:hypothetical protein
MPITMPASTNSTISACVISQTGDTGGPLVLQLAVDGGDRAVDPG